MKRIRVAQWGLGAMGSGMARLVASKPGLELVAAIDARPDYVGRDVADVLGLPELLGVHVTDDPASVLDPGRVDCVVIATTSWVRDQVADYARRKGMPLAEAERWLAPNLGYEVED